MIRAKALPRSYSLSDMPLLRAVLSAVSPDARGSPSDQIDHLLRLQLTCTSPKRDRTTAVTSHKVPTGIELSPGYLRILFEHLGTSPSRR